MQLTAEQLLASTTIGRDICLVAGAGTGKTRVLVERFAHLVQTQKVAPEDILAITFTEKAAREMQERLQTSLHRSIRGNNINTIHSCCFAWLKEYRAFADIPADVRVANEFESRYLAYDALFSTIESWQQRDAAKLEALVANMVWQGGGGDASYRGRLAATILPIYEKLRSIGYQDDWQNRLWGNIVKASAKQLQQSSQRTQSELNGMLPLLPANERAESLRSAIRTLDFTTFDLITAIDAFQRLHQLMGGRWPDEVRDSMKALRDDIDALLAAYYQELAAPQYELLGELLQDFHQQYRLAKQLQGVVDYEDLQLKMLALLENHPNVAQELRQRFPYILVDEFQDLNPIQLRLIEQIRTPHQLFVVGDIRQSIYAFRYADVHNFELLQNSLAQNRGLTLGLTKSFRSRVEILDLLNDFVALHEKVLGEGMAVGEKLVVNETKPRSAGETAVECRLYHADTTTAARQLEAKETAAWINAMTKPSDGGKPVARYSDIAILFRSSASIPLFRQALMDLRIPVEASATSGFYQTREVQDALSILKFLLSPFDDLRLAGILKSEFVGLNDAQLFELSQQERPLWSALQASQLPKLRAFVELTKELQSKILQESIYELLERVLLATRVEQAIEQQWPEWQAKQKIANLEKLLQQAQQWDQQPAVSLSSFVEMADFMLAAEVKVPQAAVHDSQDAVKLYTVHAAKGLEFPIVFVADLKRTAGGRVGSLICDRHGNVGMRLRLPNGASVAPSLYRKVSSEQRAAEMAEEMRILYVAMSRAKEKLILSSGVAGSLGRCWLKLLTQQFPIEPFIKNPELKATQVVKSNLGGSTFYLSALR